MARDGVNQGRHAAAFEHGHRRRFGMRDTLVTQWPRGQAIPSRAKAVATGDVARLTALASSGSGDVEYSGAAVLTKNRIAGSGQVRQRP
jgi:hypothetical protein